MMSFHIFLVVLRVSTEPYQINDVNWYLSVLVVFFFFILYLIQKNKNIFVYEIAPFCFLSVMGILYNKYGHLNIYNFMSPILTWGCWRDIAELCLGCIIYENFIHILVISWSPKAAIILQEGLKN